MQQAAPVGVGAYAQYQQLMQMRGVQARLPYSLDIQ
jgi:hypothetical protein